MQKTIISNAGSAAIFSQNYTLARHPKTNVVKKFVAWCVNQESNRFLWLAVSFFGLIGMVLPMTAVAILFAAGNMEILWIIACVTNVPVLVLNLSAQPPKVVLPFLLFALLTDLCIVATSLAIFFMK